MKRPKSQKPGGLSRRLHFPEEEMRLAWLPLVLDAYAVVDTGVAIAIRDTEKTQKKKLACSSGCAVCCHQEDIPVYPHELIGISWFVKEKTARQLRDVLKQQLAEHRAGAACPFLVGGTCSIHGMRPVSCRQFNVFSTPCTPGEDPYFSRRIDVLSPINDYTDRSFAAVIPLYAGAGGGDRESAIRSIRAQIMNLQTVDWKKLVVLLDRDDSPGGDARAAGNPDHA